MQSGFEIEVLHVNLRWMILSLIWVYYGCFVVRNAVACVVPGLKSRHQSVVHLLATDDACH